MGEYADEQINRIINGRVRPIENINVRRHYDYWDAQYAREDVWQNVTSTRDLELTAQALLVTLEDGSQMWIPKTICMWWKKRQFRVHTEHWEKLLAQHQGAVDLLADLDDDED